MRAFMIAVGLAATVLVADLTWFSAQLTTQRALETVTTQLSDLGFKASFHEESSLGIFPDAFIDIEGISIVIPETDEAPKPRLAIEGLRSELSCLAEIEWPSRCPRMTDAGSPRLWSAVDVSTILQQGFRSRLNDTLNLEDPTNLIQSLLKRIR
ncbi:hypothetical protein N9338_07080 [Luminiphilus sp.]|mgnify:CR=1 FL=1|nr:hypothetical protein [Luminiphilus sp.]MDB2440833.1 hypothetical protein [Luminiphilus sp.]MDB2692576.1 hypothetical protein [Luminiphilus sp.]MDB3900353.1 hypothetical protein [Luminiphilus sp.]